MRKTSKGNTSDKLHALLVYIVNAAGGHFVMWPPQSQTAACCMLTFLSAFHWDASIAHDVFTDMLIQTLDMINVK